MGYYDFLELLAGIQSRFTTGEFMRVLIKANPHFVKRFIAFLRSALGTGQVNLIGIETRVDFHKQRFDLVGLGSTGKAGKFQFVEKTSG
jgi:hypothetical protein